MSDRGEQFSLLLLMSLLIIKFSVFDISNQSSSGLAASQGHPISFSVNSLNFRMSYSRKTEGAKF